MAFINKKEAVKRLKEGAKFIARAGNQDSKSNEEYIKRYINKK